MDILTLKNRVSSNLPIYLGGKSISVIDIFEIFNLIEVKLIDEDKSFVVDIKTLREDSNKELSINLNLFKDEGVPLC